MNSFADFDFSSWVIDQFGDLVPAPLTPKHTPPPAKRGRGRPRKNPLPDPNVPRRGRGRPAGAKDSVKRRRRNEKAVLSYEERREIEKGQQRASLKKTREAQSGNAPSSQQMPDLTWSEDEQSEARAISSPNAATDELRAFHSFPSPPSPSLPHHLSPEEAYLSPADFDALNEWVSKETHPNPGPLALALEDDHEWEEDLAALHSWSPGVLTGTGTSSGCGFPSW